MFSHLRWPLAASLPAAGPPETRACTPHLTSSFWAASSKPDAAVVVEAKKIFFTFHPVAARSAPLRLVHSHYFIFYITDPSQSFVTCQVFPFIIFLSLFYVQTFLDSSGPAYWLPNHPRACSLP